MATYAQWLRKNGLTSSRTNADKWRADRSAAPAAPFSYSTQIRRDPLSIPFDSEILWQGRNRPNLASLASRGYEHLTPVERPGGGYAVFGLPSDPTPQWVKDQAAQFTQRGQQVQQYAQGTVAPWLSGQLGALGQVQTQAQTRFADLIRSSGDAAAAAGASAGPGGAYEGGGAMAPFQSRLGLGDELSRGQADSQTGAAAYQGAVAQLQGSNLAQGLSSSLAQQIARMPDQWEQQRQDFMRQMAPIIAQISQSRAQGEQARLTSLEQRRQFNANNRIEREIAGIGAEADVEQTRIETEADAAQAQADANQQALEDDYRSVNQIRQGLTVGQSVLDNQGQGFATRPSISRFHGKRVQWEQARNGRWYGVAGGGGSSAGTAAGGSERMNALLGEARDLYETTQSVPATQEDVNAGRAVVVGDKMEIPTYDPGQIYTMLRRRGATFAQARQIVKELTGAVISDDAEARRGQADLTGPRAGFTGP